MDKNSLVDLGFIGAHYTWSHEVKAETRKAAKLDRALCCYECRRVFPGATARHLGHAHSDHCPLLLDLNREEGGCMAERPFRFLAAWMLHDGFLQWMEREWVWSGDLMCSLKCFAEKLSAWNKDT